MTLKIGDKNNPIILAMKEVLPKYGFKKYRGNQWYLDNKEVLLMVDVGSHFGLYEIGMGAWIKRLATQEYFDAFKESKIKVDPLHPKQFQCHIMLVWDVPKNLKHEEIKVFDAEDDTVPANFCFEKTKEYLEKYGIPMIMKCDTEEKIRKLCAEKAKGFEFTSLCVWTRIGFKQEVKSGLCSAIHMDSNRYLICQTITYEEDDAHGYYGMVFFGQPFLCDDLEIPGRYSEKESQVKAIIKDDPCGYMRVVIPKEGYSNRTKFYDLDWRCGWRYVCELRAVMSPAEWQGKGLDKLPSMSQEECIKMLKAYYGLLSWDIYPEDPTKFDKLLLHPDQKPTTIKYRKDFIEQPDGSFVLKDK